MPDQNSRFRTSLWDIYGYMQEVWLDRISDTQYSREINNDHNYSFRILMRDLYYPLIKHRKIVRLHDMSIDQITNKVDSVNTTSNVMTLDNTSQFKMGDYVTVYEYKPNKFIGKINSNVTSGSNVTISYDTEDANYTFGGVNSYVKIIEQVDQERLVSGEYTRSPNMEVVEVSSSTTATDGGYFNADLSYDFSEGAIIIQPGRSFIAKVLAVDGYDIKLSRMDFSPEADSLVQKVNFTSFRIREINESRDSGDAISSITCDHITFDLNDTLFFKDTRTDVSYASKGAGQIIQDRVDVNTMLDNILFRHLDSGKPLSTKSFIKGDFYRHKYSKGTISRSSSSNNKVDGDGVAAFNSSSNDDGQSISPGSTLIVEGDTTLYTIIDHHADSLTEGGFVLDQNISNVSNANYLIISQGAYTEIDDKVGTCNVTINDNSLTNFSFTVTGGAVSHGAVVTLDNDNNDYYVDYVAANGTIFLNKDVERASGSGIKCSIKRDEREVSTSNLVTSMGVLNNLMEVFTDDQQEFFYNVNEDRSIDIIRKPLPDGRDPTSDLVVQYRDNQIRNLQSITRDFEISEFGNRIIPQGATSGWVNCESGVSVPVAEPIIEGVLGNGEGLGSSYSYFLDSNGKFLGRGVQHGMKITNNPTNIANLRESIVTNVTNTQIDWETFNNSSTDLYFNVGDSYKIYTGHSKSQIRVKSIYNKHFRFGDPVHIFKDKQEFTISEVSQITVRNSITGKATSSSRDGAAPDPYGDVTLPSGVASNVAPYMFIGKVGEKSPTALITNVQTNTIHYTDFYSTNRLDFSVGIDNYHIYNSSQINIRYHANGSSGSRYFDRTQQAILGDTIGTTDVYLLPNNAIQTVNNAFYFGSNDKFGYITLKLKTHMDLNWDGQIVWEYCTDVNAGTWKTLDFNVQPFVTGQESSSVTYTNEFDPPPDWVRCEITDLPGFSNDFVYDTSKDDFYFIRMRVSTANTFTGGVAAPIVGGVQAIQNREWRENRYAGGLLKIEDGSAKGVIRRVTSNTMGELVINRKFDDPSVMKGAKASITKEVGNTFVKGFGYKVLSVLSADESSITVDAVLSDNSYFGGLLTIKTGAGKGQVYKISSNELIDTVTSGATSKLYLEMEGSGSFTQGGDSMNEYSAIVSRSLNPIPEKGDQIEIVGKQFAYFEQSKDVTYSRMSSTNKGRITFTTENTGWQDDTWAGGAAYIVSGNTMQEGVIESNDGNSVLLESVFDNSSGTFSGVPATGSKAILIKETGLHLSVAEGLDFIAGRNSDVSLLLKESGGPLVVGKHYSNRAISNGSTTNMISLGEADSALKFNKNDIIFVGAKRVGSSVYFDLGTGDQVHGQQAVIKSVLSTSGYITGYSIGSDPYMIFETDISDLSASGVKVGMFLRLWKGYGTENDDYLDYMISKIGTGADSNKIFVVQKAYFSDGTVISAGNDFFTINCLELSGVLDPVAITGDHIERVGFVHESSARKNDIIEVVNDDTSTSDPEILFRNANRKLNRINEIEPRYSVSFVDLFEYDEEQYPYDSYRIGDTIKIVDEDITGAGGANLRVLKESFSPELPADKTHTLEVGKKRRRFFRDDYAKVKRDINTLKQEVKEAELNSNMSMCMWWDYATKTCTRTNPPNYFCESSESNFDGRMTKEKMQITKLHCQSYSPSNRKSILGGETTITDSVSYRSIAVTNTTYPTDLSGMHPIDVDFVLNPLRTKVHIFDAVVQGSTSAAVDPAGVDVALELDEYGNVVPYNELGHGGYFKLKRGSGTVNTLVSVIAVPVGYES